MDIKDVFEITDQFIHHTAIILIKAGNFNGVEYTYGAVAIEEDDNGAVLKFDYTVVAGEELITDKIEFKQLTGDILMCIMENQLTDNSVIYKGGVDE